uniref:Uncharacterized protein n=1 Tax=Rhizophora mucronata TaxID=61149 RepID=A0A2P2PEK1_RHIMU
MKRKSNEVRVRLGNMVTARSWCSCVSTAFSFCKKEFTWPHLGWTMHYASKFMSYVSLRHPSCS